MRYPAIVTREQGAYVIEFPSNPGCQTQTETSREVLPAAQEALEGWTEAMLSTGGVPPLPPARARARRGKTLLWVELPARLAVKVELRSARHRARLTLAQLAKRAGVTQQQIAQLEHPDSNPTLQTLEGVAAALGARLEISLEPIKRAAGS